MEICCSMVTHIGKTAYKKNAMFVTGTKRVTGLQIELRDPRRGTDLIHESSFIVLRLYGTLPTLSYCITLLCHQQLQCGPQLPYHCIARNLQNPQSHLLSFHPVQQILFIGKHCKAAYSATKNITESDQWQLCPASVRGNRCSLINGANNSIVRMSFRKGISMALFRNKHIDANQRTQRCAYKHPFA